MPRLLRLFASLTAILTLPLFIISTAQAQAPPFQNVPIRTLHTFDNTYGATPTGRFVQGADGAFYGLTANGGLGYGTIYKITPNGQLTTLFKFNKINGASPVDGLCKTSDGTFYGATSAGGRNNTGTIFKMTPEGALTTLYQFPAVGSYNMNIGGATPGASPFLADDGSLYGTTTYGGSVGDGTIYKLSPQRVLTVLHEFNYTYMKDGAFPVGMLTLGLDGALYGLTFAGGERYPVSEGTMYRITKNDEYTLVYTFDSTHGDHPRAGLTLGKDGDFYGTTEFGGFRSNGEPEYLGGTIFKITPQGQLTTLHSFDFNSDDGFLPYGNLSLGVDGNFYGTTICGGGTIELAAKYQGTVFRITPKGQLTSLYKFFPESGGINPHGRYPYGGVLLDANNTLLGTTSYGGPTPRNYGTIFKLALPQQ